MIKATKKLLVKFNGKEVGVLSQVEEKIAFQYSQDWIDNGFSISPFSLPLSRQIYISTRPQFGGLFGVFADCLPDGWGELLMSRMLQKHNINYATLSPLTKLALVGSNGLGGLVFEPTQALYQESDLDLDALAQQAERILDDGGLDEDLDYILYLGGSSGGARPKAHVKDGLEEWIIKFPCRIDPPNVGATEYAMNIKAQKCGIRINQCRLFSSAICSGYFGAKRFDRIGQQRVHVISLSGVLEVSHRMPVLDYMHLMQVVDTICVDKTDLYQAYARMCYNVIHKNRDDHGKNFAFVYDQELQGYRLSPAYDITYTPNKPEHEMTVLGNGTPTEKDLLNLAKQCRLSTKRCQNIIATIKSVQ